MTGRRTRVPRPRPPGPSVEAARFATLAEAAGSAWFDDEAGALAAAGRALTGGWPGTLSEARTRVVRSIAHASGSSVSPGAATELARMAYRAARECWRLRVTRELPDPDEE